MGEVIQFPTIFRREVPRKGKCELVRGPLFDPAEAPDAPWLDSNVTPQDKLTGRTALRRLMEIHEEHKDKE